MLTRAKKKSSPTWTLGGIRPILEALEARGQLANTVIFFTSDNGYMLGEHRLTAKDKPYWESSEVPFFVKGPGIKKGSRAALVNHTDLMPTTCEIARIPFSSLDVDGRSMLANLGRDAFSNWRKRMLVSGSAAWDRNKTLAVPTTLQGGGGFLEKERRRLSFVKMGPKNSIG